jgi:hypothetical protein
MAAKKKKQKKRRLPRQAQAAQTRAAAMAAATKGRARVFKDKRKSVPNAKRDIQDQLDAD